MKNILTITLCLLLFSFKNVKGKTPGHPVGIEKDTTIQYIDIVHCTHTDYGYTDHPVIIEELQTRFFDMAVSLGLKSEGAKQPFVWTAEAMEPVERWWNEATPERRKGLLRLIGNKQISINALPFNFNPVAPDAQLNTMTNWVNKDLWGKFQPNVGMQSDVTGFSRAAAAKLLDKGIKYAWTGINEHKASSPFPQPYPFWWKMPDGRRMLVWCGLSYWEGFSFFTEKEWRSEQREASNLQFWSPREGDMLQPDEVSVRKAHKICLERVKQMKKGGYPYDFISVTITNQWRIDNDGPFPGLTAFVQKWNELELQPKLNLVTVDHAMERIEKRIGKVIPEHEGEWPDWWSFGIAANPRELSVSRQAARYLEVALSPAWGTISTKVQAKSDEINRLLCRYYEHTFSANESLSNPNGIMQLGQLNEKGTFAYRSYEKAKWLLAQRVSNLLSNKTEGLYVINTHKNEYSGWIELDPIAFRGIDYKSIENVETKERISIKNGGGTKFWASNLKNGKINRFMLSTEMSKPIQEETKPEIRTDKNNWPEYIKWDGMAKPLITEGLAEISSLEINGSQWSVSSIFKMQDSIRLAKLKETVTEINSISENDAMVEETQYSIKYIQKIKHPRMKWATRQLEIFKNEPKISIEVKFDRISSIAPEVIFIDFPLPKELKSPLASSGGLPYYLYTDQLPNSCKDYFAVDSWVAYSTSNYGSWVWTTHDAPMVTFGAHNLDARIKKAPDNVNVIKSMVYNNTWEVNYLVDCPGEMSFKYDLDWRQNNLESVEINEIARANLFPPVVFRNPATKANPISNKSMFE
uniref:glycoside hydrolase family 38 N-terminal domain-containing protein n=1 Tax=Pedobacter schmidteae TaxID=2201271 RepID=UPI000EB4EC45|nr:hypothetical protein [Pedobacter schmidteae]